MRNLYIFGLAFLILISSAFAVLDNADVYYSYDTADTTGSSLDDVSGNGVTGTCTMDSDCDAVAGLLSQASDFDGTNDKIITSSAVTLGTTFSINIWVKTTAAQYIVTTRNYGGTWFTLQADAGGFLAQLNNGGTLVDSNVPPSGSWQMVTLTLDGSNARIYVDGVLKDTKAVSASHTNNKLDFGFFGAAYWQGLQDEFAFYAGRTLTSGEITTLYNGGVGYNPYAVAPTNNFFNVQADDVFNGATLSDITVTLENGTTYTNATNSIVYTPFNDSRLINFTVSVNNYFNQSFTNYNTSVDITANLTQAYATFYAYELITNNSINGSVLINGNYYNTGEVISINQSNHTVTFNASGYFDKSSNFEVLALSNQTYNIYSVGNAQVNVSFYNAYGNTSATNVSGYIYNSTYNYNETFDTGAAGYSAFNIVQNVNFTVVINNNKYSLQQFPIYTTSTYKNQTEYLYTFNSVLITFKEQDSLASMNGKNVTIEFISDADTIDSWTTNGTFYADLLSPADYTLRYTASNYATSFYYFTLLNQTDIQLTLYLINESIVTDVTFIVLDEINTKIEDAVIKIHKYNPSSGNYNLIEIIQTNFEGEAVAPIELGAEFYYFIVEYPAGTVVKTTTPSYIYDTTVQLPIILTDPIAAAFFRADGVSSSLIFNNATNNFKYTFSDGANLVEQGCLIVYKVSAFDRTVYNSSCSTGASGQVLLNVVNSSGTTYLAQGYVEFTDETTSITASLWKTFGILQTLGTLGVFGLVIILITMALLGAWNPAVAVILTSITLTMGKVVGFLSIGWDYVIGIVALGLIIVFMISRKS